MLPAYSAGVVVARNIEISGIKTQSEKFERLKQGLLSKILNFRISSLKEVEYGNDSVKIKGPIILG